MIRLALRPNSSGGMSDPRRLPPPLGTSDGLLLPIGDGVGDFSLDTSMVGASGALISGVLISGTFGYKQQPVLYPPNSLTIHRMLMAKVLQQLDFYGFVKALRALK